MIQVTTSIKNLLRILSKFLFKLKIYDHFLLFANACLLVENTKTPIVTAKNKPRPPKPQSLALELSSFFTPRVCP